MQAANWYQYEESYRKYGFDMKPEQLNKPKPKPAAGTGIAAKDKKTAGAYGYSGSNVYCDYNFGGIRGHAAVPDKQNHSGKYRNLQRD